MMLPSVSCSALSALNGRGDAGAESHELALATPDQASKTGSVQNAWWRMESPETNAAVRKTAPANELDRNAGGK
jgi:hypothetical protein